MYPKAYLEIIKDVCIKHSIGIQFFPGESILRLSQNDNVHYIWSRRFDLNSAISARIADNKFATYIVLYSFNVPTIECIKLSRMDTEEYANSEIGNVEACQKLLSTNSSIVIKPNNSYEGTDVYKCESVKDIEKTLQLLGNKYKFLIVSPFIESVAEYRVIYLNGKIMFIYQKVRPYLVCDGKSSVMELLVKSNYNLTQLDNKVMRQISNVYPEGYTLQLSWKFNLSQGANCIPVTDDNLRNNVSYLALTAAKAINISFATIDILQSNTGELYVLEINAGVAMDQFIQKYPNGRDLAFSIYEKAVLSMFN